MLLLFKYLGRIYEKIFDWSVFTVDADRIAQKIGNPKSFNLILLGFALAAVSKSSERAFFCSLEDIQTVLENRLADKVEMLQVSLTAVEAGYEFGL